MTNQAQRSHSQPIVKWLFMLYLLFVVYGSLVPLKYVYRPLGDAILAFQNIPFLQLGVESRADWVANGVLYVPLGFLLVAALTQAARQFPKVLLLVAALAFSVAVAVGVEFTQLYFPQRTVSLNDIMAECVGGLLGVMLAAKYLEWFDALLDSLVSDPRRLMLLALDGYAVAYLALSLFPYDLLLSAAELGDKLASTNLGWFVAGSSPRPMLLGFQSLAELVMTLPFGFLLARLTRGRSSFFQAAVAGLVLGAGIEVAQLFIASGVSQGLSVLTRTAGVCGGLALSRSSHRWTLDLISATLRRFTPALSLAYAMALLEANGWFTLHWHGLGFAAAQLGEVNFMPFYYHYFTTEAIALFSLGAVTLSYIPLGVLTWAHGRSSGFSLVIAALSATVIEAFKLFIEGAHPDPTNIILAGVSGALTVGLLRHLSQLKPAGEQNSAKAAVAPVRDSSRGGTPLLLPVLAAGVAGIWLAGSPAFTLLVGLALGVCSAVVWYRPAWAFAIIPATLPALDLAPWSGRFFLDEFDILLFVVLTIAFVRAPNLPSNRRRSDLLFVLLATLLALSFSTSVLRAMLPLPMPNPNSFNNYFSPYNALRIAKGAAWACLTILLSRRFFAIGIDVRRPFAGGLAIGLGLTVIAVLWERLAFAELWNFSGDYRVTGLFSATHTGGAYIDCFIAVAMPFLIVLAFEKRHWLAKFAGALLILGGTYALMVTFSRAGYLAFAATVVIVLVVLAVNTGRTIAKVIVVIGLASAMLMVAMPVFKGEFAQSRMSEAGTDMTFRKAHWDDALNIRDPGWATALFGMGVGRFPETRYWRSSLDSKVGTYRLETEKGNTFLRLDSGDAIGVDQFVAVQPGQTYVLRFDVRASRPNAQITVPICEKWLLTSDHCVTPSFELAKASANWQTVEARFSGDEFPSRPWYRQRPVKLSITYAVPQSTVDIDNLVLLDEHNINLLRNGDFSQGLDHWFFATAGTLHAHWRVHSLYYAVLFDQGWFGVLAFGALIFLALARSARRAWRGDLLSTASIAALVGFLVGGIFDTQIDAPRFLMLLLLLVWACTTRNLPLTGPATPRPEEVNSAHNKRTKIETNSNDRLPLPASGGK